MRPAILKFNDEFKLHPLICCGRDGGGAGESDGGGYGGFSGNDSSGTGGGVSGGGGSDTDTYDLDYNGYVDVDDATKQAIVDAGKQYGTLSGLKTALTMMTLSPTTGLSYAIDEVFDNTFEDNRTENISEIAEAYSLPETMVESLFDEGLDEVKEQTKATMASMEGSGDKEIAEALVSLYSPDSTATASSEETPMAQTQTFDEATYLQNKADQLNRDGNAGAYNPYGVQAGQWTADDVRAALAAAGLTPETHYNQYGKAEDVSPDTSTPTEPAPTDQGGGGQDISDPNSPKATISTHGFNQNAYLINKADQLNRVGNDGAYNPYKIPEGQWTKGDVLNALSHLGMSPEEHYNTYGKDEGISPYASVTGDTSLGTSTEDIGETGGGGSVVNPGTGGGQANPYTGIDIVKATGADVGGLLAASQPYSDPEQIYQNIVGGYQKPGQNPHQLENPGAEYWQGLLANAALPSELSLSIVEPYVPGGQNNMANNYIPAQASGPGLLASGTTPAEDYTSSDIIGRINTAYDSGIIDEGRKDELMYSFDSGGNLKSTTSDTLQDYDNYLNGLGVSGASASGPSEPTQNYDPTDLSENPLFAGYDPVSPVTTGSIEPVKKVKTPIETRPAVNTNYQNPQGYQAPADWRPDETETVQGRLDGLLAQDSTYMQNARESGLRTAQSRGLLNSALAAGQSQKSAIDAALPIAQQDSQSFVGAGMAGYQGEIQGALDSQQGRISGELSRQSHDQGLETIWAQEQASSRLSAQDSGQILRQVQFQALMDSGLSAQNAAQQSGLSAQEAEQAIRYAEFAGLVESGLSAQQAAQTANLSYQEAQQALALSKYKTSSDADLSYQEYLQNLGQMKLDGRITSNLSNQEWNQSMQLDWQQQEGANYRAELEAQLKIDMANAELTSQERQALASGMTALGENFQDKLTGINADPDMPEESKTAAIAQAEALYRANLQTLGGIYDVNISWEMAA